MREWIKSILGNTPSLPEGVTPEWVTELKTMLSEAWTIGGTNLSGPNLDSAVDYVLRGETGTWVHPVPPLKKTGYVSHRHDKRPEQPDFYAPLASIPDRKSVV